MKTRLYAIAAVAGTGVLLGGLYFAFKPSAGTPTPEHAASATYRLAISKQPPSAESTVYKARQGDRVTLVVTADRPGAVNVHGYEKEVALKPGEAVTLTFVAEHAGRYPVHLHGPDGSHLEVGALEVQPR